MAVNIYDLQVENAQELIRIYTKRSEQLKQAIINIVKSGGDISTLAREKNKIDKILKKLRKELKNLVAEQITFSYEQGFEETKKDYSNLKIALLIGAMTPKLEFDLIKTYQNHADWAIDRIQTKVNAFVRKDFSTVKQSIKNVEALSYNRLGLKIPDISNKRELARNLEEQLKTNEIFRVPYYHRTGKKAGQIFSHVKIDTYCRMLARTLTAEADRKAVIDTVKKSFEPYGDLVQFVKRGFAKEHSCDDCDFLAGAYLSLNGKTKGYMTVGEAEAEYDIFHPNCIHTLRITSGVLEQYYYLGKSIPRDKAA